MKSLFVSLNVSLGMFKYVCSEMEHKHIEMLKLNQMMLQNESYKAWLTANVTQDCKFTVLFSSIASGRIFLATVVP